MPLRVLFAVVSLFVSAHHSKPKAPKHPKEDFAAEGQAAAQEGNYLKAIGLLKKAAAATPTNAFVWFNLGHATAAYGQNEEGGDDCDDDKSWKYGAMNAFNKALALDHAEIWKRLTQADPKLQLLRETAEYKKWMDSQAALPKGDEEATQFFTDAGSWFTPGKEIVFMDLETGGTLQRYGPTDDEHGDSEGHWRIKKGGLEVTLNDQKPQKYLLQHGPFSWQLKGPEGIWEPGPILRDCSAKKK